MLVAKNDHSEELHASVDELVEELQGLQFTSPVTHVYNPLRYARTPFAMYLDRYGRCSKEVLFVGMNPGPWGMAQTGIPFGEVNMVREWLQIEAFVEVPHPEHPKRPVLGFSCRRSEVSGRRLWGWARKVYREPGRFFRRFLVLNYCPLVFFEKSGRNRTPDTLPAEERKKLYGHCDRALRTFVLTFQARSVVGVGRFAEKRAREALAGLAVQIGAITHPSPANPRANRGWENLVAGELADLGIEIP